MTRAKQQAAFVCAFVVGLISACDATTCPEARLEPVTATPRFAVVQSDYSSSAIALLDDQLTLLTEAWIDSGTTVPKLASTLSGDIVLPTTAAEANVLTTIDRTGVVTRIEIPTGTVLSQLRTRMTDKAGGFQPNPHDYLPLGDGTALVSRSEPNLTPDAPSEDHGNDLIRIDIETGELVRRYDLAPLDASEGSTRFYARPDRLVHLGDFVAIGLVRASLGYQEEGPGAVGFLDLSDDTLHVVHLDGLANCGEIAQVQATDRALVVLCIGDGGLASGWYDPDSRRARAGLALIEVSPTGSLELSSVYRASDHPNIAPPSTGLIPLSRTRVLAMAAGSRTETDALVDYDLDAQTAVVLYKAADSFVLGNGCLSPLDGSLLVPDAGRGVLRFTPRVSDATYELTSEKDCSICRKWGPREIRVLPPPI